VLVAVYVDDIIVIGNNSADIKALKAFLDEKSRIKDLGELHYFLGMELLKVPNDHDTKKVCYGVVEGFSM